MCLCGTDLSPSLCMWAAREEAAGDHREELCRLHVLNLFVKGERRVEGMEGKCTIRPIWKHQVAGSGQEAFEAELCSLHCDGPCDRFSLRWQGGEPGAPRGPSDHSDLFWVRRRENQLELNTALPDMTAKLVVSLTRKKHGKGHSELHKQETPVCFGENFHPRYADKSGHFILVKLATIIS